jgi:hypothetical protein
MGRGKFVAAGVLAVGVIAAIVLLQKPKSPAPEPASQVAPAPAPAPEPPKAEAPPPPPAAAPAPAQTAAVPPPVGGQDGGPPPPLSEAQLTLFETQHLQAITKPAKIDYAFERASPKGDGFTDAYEMDIRDIRPDGGKDVYFSCMSGTHQYSCEPMMDFRGNPLLMMFLDRDVADMNKLTGGSTVFFRNHIRRAFLDQAVVKPTTITVGGKQMPAKSIWIQPYKGDTHMSKTPDLELKTYEFVMSDAVPGMLYQIKTTTAPDQPADKQVRETLTYAEVKP